MPVRVVKYLLGVLKQFLVEMNINIAAAEATELEHKKTFDELSDTKSEEIAASNQQHKEKSLKEQDTKLSNDRNATELKRTQESVGDQEAFLANLGQLDICEIQTIAESIETLHENEDQARDHFSKTNSSSLPQPTCKAFSPLGRSNAFGVWLQRRVKLEEDIVELDATLVLQLKSSRCAEDEEGSADAVLRNRQACEAFKEESACLNR